jgi:hypothetical protein
MKVSDTDLEETEATVLAKASSNLTNFLSHEYEKAALMG